MKQQDRDRTMAAERRLHRAEQAITEKALERAEAERDRLRAEFDALAECYADQTEDLIATRDDLLRLMTRARAVLVTHTDNTLPLSMLEELLDRLETDGRFQEIPNSP